MSSIVLGTGVKMGNVIALEELIDSWKTNRYLKNSEKMKVQV